MTRAFTIPCAAVAADPVTAAAEAQPAITITLHEPPLISDALGLKTWGTSYLLAKRLHHLVPSILPSTATSSSSPTTSSPLRALEMGSGTGLVGLSAAALFGWDSHLTDLTDVVPNLANNIAANAHLFPPSSSSSLSSVAVVARVLDWTQPLADEYWQARVGSFDVILASDPLYTPQHPGLVVSCVSLFLRKPTADDAQDSGGRFIIEHPLRPSHMEEVVDCEAGLEAAGLVREAVGEEVGWDDWGVSRLQQERLRLGGEDDEHVGGVRCRWGVWRWRHWGSCSADSQERSSRE
jgi:hypothetical protein